MDTVNIKPFLSFLKKVQLSTERKYCGLWSVCFLTSVWSEHKNSLLFEHPEAQPPWACAACGF